MRLPCGAAGLALLLCATDAPALTIKVVGPKHAPVAGAKIIIESHPDRDDIEHGETDGNGEFKAKKSYENVEKIYIRVIPQAKDNLDPASPLTDIKGKEAVTIQLTLSLLPMKVQKKKCGER